MILLESFSYLLRDPGHWGFELLVGGIEMLLFDLMIGAILWPRIKAHIHRDLDELKIDEHHLLFESQDVCDDYANELDRRLSILEELNRLYDDIANRLNEVEENVILLGRQAAGIGHRYG